MPAIQENELLAQLPSFIYQQIKAEATVINVQSGQALACKVQQTEYVYFPQTALLSLVHIFPDAVSTEVLMIGPEGMAAGGFSAAGVYSSIIIKVVHTGSVIRLSHSALQKLALNCSELQLTITAHTMSLMQQLCQVIACYRHHSIKQQLSRLLLAYDDRYPTRPIIITQAELAEKLGVRREAVSMAAGYLQHAGALRYHRGHIGSINRSMLLQHSCECYQVLQAAQSRKPG